MVDFLLSNKLYLEDEIDQVLFLKREHTSLSTNRCYQSVKKYGGVRR